MYLQNLGQRYPTREVQRPSAGDSIFALVERYSMEVTSMIIYPIWQMSFLDNDMSTFVM